MNSISQIKKIIPSLRRFSSSSERILYTKTSEDTYNKKMNGSKSVDPKEDSTAYKKYIYIFGIAAFAFIASKLKNS